MRTDSINFRRANIAEVGNPVVVVEISFNNANSDLYYLTSHSGVPTPAGNKNNNCIKSLSSTSQKLNVASFSSTIGSIKIGAIDDGTLTDYFRTKLFSGKTPSKNRLRLYAGYANQNFNDFSLVQTQIVKDVTYSAGLMTINCLDIQRDTKKTVFEPHVTILTANVVSTDTTINVQNSSAFDMVYHGASYTDSPSSTVGYATISDGEKIEVFRYTGKTSTSFTGVTRGVHGSIPLDFQALDGDGENREIEVTEFIYLELPVAKLIYAILTGNLYGDAGQSLPDNWHLGIDTQWISTANFTNIGSDLWDTSDDNAGKVAYFAGIEKEDGRKFINEQLLPMIGCFMPISAAGQLGLRRITSIISSSNYVAVLNEENIKSLSPVRYAMDEVINQMRVDWTYDYQDEDYRRASLFVDTGSSSIYGLRPEKVVELKGMYGTRHSRDFIRGLFNSLRDRFGGEPLYLKADLLPGLNVLEVGDVVRLSLDNWQDYTNLDNLDRTFEVQGVTVDWLKGNVSVDLFGSSRKAGELADDGEGYGDGYGVPDGVYGAEGTNIETAFPAQTSRSGTLVTLNSSITFTGADLMTEGDGTPNPSAILYCLGDLTIPPGVTLNINKNVFLIIQGFLTVNGTINGAGRGPVGGDSRRTYVNQRASSAGLFGFPRAGVGFINQNGAYTAPSQGYMHAPLNAQRSLLIEVSGSFGSVSANDTNGFEAAYPAPPESIPGIGLSYQVTSQNPFPVMPELNFIPSNLKGLPRNLQGGSGPAGGHLFYPSWGNPLDYSDDVAIPLARGSNGGNGGAGLATLTRGMDFGAAGKIDLSGGAAANNPGTSVQLGETFVAGVGCGGSPGAWYCLIDGGDSVAPIVSLTTYVANYGWGSSIGGTNWSPIPTLPGMNWGVGSSYPEIPGNNHASPITGTSQTLGGANASQGHHRVQFLVPTEAPPGVETPSSVAADDVVGLSATEVTNTPQTPLGNLSSIEVTVTPPTDTGYSYAVIYYRKSNTTAWTRVAVPAEPETVISGLPSDGSEYVIQARAVSITGHEKPTGPTVNITLTSVTAVEDYILEQGYDDATESWIRVIETATGDVVYSVGKNGTIDNGTIGTDVVIPGVERPTVTVHPAISRQGYPYEYVIRGSAAQTITSDDFVILYAPTSTAAGQASKIVYPINIGHDQQVSSTAGRLTIDKIHQGDYRELRFAKGGSGVESQSGAYFCYAHGAMGLRTISGTPLALGGFGIYYHAGDGNWYLYAQQNNTSSATPTRVAVPELDDSTGTNAQTIKIIYTGQSARGGTDELVLYIDGTETASLSGVTSIKYGASTSSWELDCVMFGIFSCRPSAVSGGGRIETGNFKFFSAYPADMNP